MMQADEAIEVLHDFESTIAGVDFSKADGVNLAA